LQNFALGLQPMEISKRYNSAPVKDAVCTNPLFSGLGYLTMPVKFLPCRPLLPWQRILRQKLTITQPSWKIIARCFRIYP